MVAYARGGLREKLCVAYKEGARPVRHGRRVVSKERVNGRRGGRRVAYKRCGRETECVVGGTYRGSRGSFTGCGVR